YAYEKAGRRANKFSTHVTQMIKDGKTLEAARDEIFAEVRDNFTAFLAGAKKDQPWLYWFGPTNTHRLWVKGSGKAFWKIDPASCPTCPKCARTSPITSAKLRRSTPTSACC